MSEFERYADMLPEGSLPIAGICIVDYLDAEGESHFHFKADGEQSLSQTVGMLVRAAISYAADGIPE